ncbi:UNVERIFIED_CONTAM: hypothetical protein Sradi_4729300 [Sesamum radiatum]|uniref:Uncharacterized protein n=1 Tax=Sesamum radiatum TaxID=300843 RepID=A0AAW2MUF4_SESRA
MKKFPSARKIIKTQMLLLMEPHAHLTQPEMDAALQLIQLSADSAESAAKASGEESVGDSNEVSSAVKNRDVEALRRGKKRYRSIYDLYSAIPGPVRKKQG